jgi:hypothetical protein
MQAGSLPFVVPTTLLVKPLKEKGKICAYH